jgi:DNA-binding LacI/PurR family transcriptional regulator
LGRVTLQTIADRVGVSRMTVSNAFSRPDQLSEKLRNHILKVAEELGYVGPDPAARALAVGSSGAIGLLLSETPAYALTDEVATTFVAATADELAPSGLALTLLSAAPKTGRIPARDVPMDGVLVYSCDVKSNAVDWLMRRRLPCVFVDQDPAPGVPSVNIEDRGGALLAARHVGELGHRRVLVVLTGFAGDFGLLPDPAAAELSHIERERLTGWVVGLAEFGIAPVVMRLRHANPPDIGYAAGRALLELDERPTAVLCFSDAIARGVVDALHEADLHVPDDVSVVGYDDTALSRRMQPPLTTVHQDSDAKARLAVRTLLTMIENARTGKKSRVRHHLLPTELIVRGSTAKAPREG